MTASTTLRFSPDGGRQYQIQTPAEPSATERLRVSGIDLAYLDSGAGTPVVALHCSGASHRQWRPLVKQLAPRYRMLVPDLPGHGQSPDLPDAARRTRDHHADIIAALAEQTGGEPFHLVAHSYGAALALHLALRWQDRLLSLTLAEPAAFELLREEGETPAWNEIDRVAQRHMALTKLGDPAAAADVFMGYWLGRSTWKSMPEQRKQAVVSTMGSVADSWPDVYRPNEPLSEYRNLAVPTLLIRGTETTRAAARVIDLLQSVLPNHRLLEVESAGHMAPVTHPEIVNGAIAGHLNRQTARARAITRLSA